ncbi:MAG: hypothetical protein ACETVR_01700 [Candidatus Bathyarchaeia archaeon]
MNLNFVHQGDLGSLFSSLWFLLFIFLFLIPQIQRYSINQRRRSLLRKLGRDRGSTVITLIHRQETIAFLGLPITRYIDIDDSEEVLRAIRMAPKESPIDLIMHTPGGIALAATQIALALKSHPGKKTVIIPHYAMSGGTLIALAADEVCMDPHAVLGPVDPQLSDQTGTYPASSIIKVTEKKKVDEIDDRTLILAEESRKAVKQMENLVSEILGDRFDEKTKAKLLEELVGGKYTHDYPITAEEVGELLGACVNKELPKEVYQLMSLYRMEVAPRRPGVEFVPVMPHSK